MHQITFGDPGTHRCSTIWRADVPTLTKPPINVNPVDIKGVKHYQGHGGKLYIAEQFDKMFPPKPHGKVNLKARRDSAGRVK